MNPKRTLRTLRTDGSDTGVDGQSWANAFATLQKPLSVATPSGDEIWVKAGTYYPDEGPGYTNNNRSHSFVLQIGVGVYGGFDGTESSKSRRDWVANATILGGDIKEDDLLFHDERAPEPTLAYLLSRMHHPEFPEPLGVFRAVQRPTYEALANQQIATARAQHGEGTLEMLFDDGETWVVN